MVRTRGSPSPAGLTPLSPRKKWRAILLATLLLAPAYWTLLAGLVAVVSGEKDAPPAGPYIAFGLAVVPFVFIVLAFLSEHPHAPAAVVKAMVLTLLVGIPASALAADAVTGMVAGIGAGGIVCLRSDLAHSWKARAVAVVAVTIYCALLLRTVSGVALLIAPALPFTASGVADHLSERRLEKRSSAA